METLIRILKNETKSLKEQYMEKTLTWAENHYNELKQRKNWNEVDWCKCLGIIPEIANKGTRCEFLTYPKGFFNTKLSRELSNLQNEIRIVMKLGLNDFLNKERQRAELHYENSILKLAKRIQKKGLNQQKLQVKTSHIGVNIETVLTDGKNTVKAFTIVAQGEIQRPHYRYLIK